MDGGLYQRVAVFWVFVKTLFPVAPIIFLARTLIAVAALCRDARPCVSTVPEKSYGFRRETQNVASLQCNTTRQKCNASQHCIPTNTINPFFHVMDVKIVFKIHLLCLTINSKGSIVYLPPVLNGTITRVANIS